MWFTNAGCLKIKHGFHWLLLRVMGRYSCRLIPSTLWVLEAEC